MVFRPDVLCSILEKVILSDHIGMSVSRLGAPRSSKANPKNISLFDIHCFSFSIFL